MPRREFGKATKREWLDVAGKRFGRLIVMCKHPKPVGYRAWICACDCGKATVVTSSNLVSGSTRSCGCYKTDVNRKHSFAHPKSPEYRAWLNMRSRCNNPNTPKWENYGGRGIAVCDRWGSFEPFLADVGRRPGPEHSLDRIDVNGNYEPGNVRWATRKQQARNVRTNRVVRYKGQDVPLIHAVEDLGAKYNTILYRLRRGKTVEEALR